MKKLVGKVLTMDVFRRDPVTRKPGPVEATLVGWQALDDFLKQHGTALVRENVTGIGEVINFPPGWDGMCVGMENVYDDGTSEKW